MLHIYVWKYPVAELFPVPECLIADEIYEHLPFIHSRWIWGW